MGFVSRLFLLGFCVNFVGIALAFARMPEKPAERSLLYWRYLCHGERQEESVKDDTREFKCLAQGWRVRTPASSGTVKEIIDESP